MLSFKKLNFITVKVLKLQVMSLVIMQHKLMKVKVKNMMFDKLLVTCSSVMSEYTLPARDM